VLVQTYPPHEIVVVIDGADRGSEEVVRQIPDHRVRALLLPEPSGDGGASARNAGVRIATGDWIAFLDDDDEWLPEKLERQISLFGHDFDRDIVVASRARREGPDGVDVWPLRGPRAGEHIGEYLFVRGRPGEGWLGTPTLMTPRRFAQRVPFKEGLRQHVDFDWVLRAQQAGADFAVVPEVLTVVYAPAARGSVSTRSTWRASLSWASEMRPLLGERAFSAFCLTEAARRATGRGSFAARVSLLWNAMSGKPRPRDLARFLASWGLPRSLRQALSRSRRQAPRREP
jgi:glycosyltransferase involved in cell wall biosynthesis